MLLINIIVITKPHRPSDSALNGFALLFNLYDTYTGNMKSTAERSHQLHKTEAGHRLAKRCPMKVPLCLRCLRNDKFFSGSYTIK